MENYAIGKDTLSNEMQNGDPDYLSLKSPGCITSMQIKYICNSLYSTWDFWIQVINASNFFTRQISIKITCLNSDGESVTGPGNQRTSYH